MGEKREEHLETKQKKMGNSMMHNEEKIVVGIVCRQEWQKELQRQCKVW